MNSPATQDHFLIPKKNLEEKSGQLIEKIPVSELKPKVINEFEKRLGLSYAEDPPEFNLCMANSDEVMADFKFSFTARDLQDYIRGYLNSSPGRETFRRSDSEFVEISYPDTPDTFWELAESGNL